MMNGLMRTNATADSAVPLQRVSATILNPDRLRIKQNETSKINLQALLAAMLVCFLSPCALMDMGSTLPHSPMTIAVSMSLLAGGEVCINESHQAETFEEFEKRLQGLRFRMGWWSESGEEGNSGEEEERGRLGIDVVKTAANLG